MVILGPNLFRVIFLGLHYKSSLIDVWRHSDFKLNYLHRKIESCQSKRKK